MEQNNRQIYLLSPKSLSPETIAVTFAKTSRSAQSFREIAAEFFAAEKVVGSLMERSGL